MPNFYSLASFHGGAFQASKKLDRRVGRWHRFSMFKMNAAILAWIPMMAIVAHYYIWRRLVRDARLPVLWHNVATLALTFLGGGMPIVLVLRRFFAYPVNHALSWVMFCWSGVFFLTFVLLLIGQVAQTVALFVAKRLNAAPIDPQRRLFFSRLLSGAVASSALTASAVAAHEALAGPEVTRIQVPLARLPKALHGMTIVQISDLHIAPQLGLAYVQNVVAQTNALKPDLIVITGDLIDGPLEVLRDMAAPLAGLHARHGTYFVTGNHEYYANVDAWLEEFGRLGMTVLRNERVIIGTAAGSFDLAGIDDLSAARYGASHGADLPRALKGRDAGRELILLAHQPKAIFEAAAHGVGLMLSGHTHAGQIWPLGYFVRLVQPYVQGLALHEQTYVYVNRGTGYVGPPMRLAAVPELTLLELLAPV